MVELDCEVLLLHSGQCFEVPVTWLGPRVSTTLVGATARSVLKNVSAQYYFSMSEEGTFGKVAIVSERTQLVRHCDGGKL